LSASSDTDGITGIVLDQDNRNYSGICVENPFITLSPASRPQTDDPDTSDARVPYPSGQQECRHSI